MAFDDAAAAAVANGLPLKLPQLTDKRRTNRSREKGVLIGYLGNVMIDMDVVAFIASNGRRRRLKSSSSHLHPLL